MLGARPSCSGWRAVKARERETQMPFEFPTYESLPVDLPGLPRPTMPEMACWDPDADPDEFYEDCRR